MEVRIDDLAIEEIREATTWYHEQGGLLAERFVGELNKALDKMESDPERNGVIEAGLRKCRLNAFPYAVIYRLTAPDQIEVVAVAHHSRSPRYWRDR